MDGITIAAAAAFAFPEAFAAATAFLTAFAGDFFFSCFPSSSLSTTTGGAALTDDFFFADGAVTALIGAVAAAAAVAAKVLDRDERELGSASLFFSFFFLGDAFAIDSAAATFSTTSLEIFFEATIATFLETFDLLPDLKLMGLEAPLTVLTTDSTCIRYLK